MGTTFYGTDDAPLQQGDIVLAPVGRFESGSRPRPKRWEPLDQLAVDLTPTRRLPTFTAVAGYGLAMITTHDCQMDKEFIERVEQLRRRAGVSLAQAETEAEADPDLDRFLTVSPLVSLDSYRATPVAITSGTVIGAFHVPAWTERGIDEHAVDLTYSTTVDRASIVRRVAVLSEEARTSLRYALARLDAFRTPAIGFELEQAVGKRIFSVKQHPDNPLVVVLELVDGTCVELVMQPAHVEQHAPARRVAPTTSE